MRVPLSLIEGDPRRGRMWLHSWARHCLIVDAMSRVEFEEHPHTIEIIEASGITQREVEVLGEMVVAEEAPRTLSRIVLW